MSERARACMYGYVVSVSYCINIDTEVCVAIYKQILSLPFRCDLST